MLKRTTVLLLIVLASFSTSAFAYDFWGITMGTAVNPAHASDGAQLSFGAVPGGIQYAVGGYKWTAVDGVWNTTAYEAASPGPGYAVFRKCDALGIFFKPEATVARFTIFTGMPQTGTTAPECGYGTRVFGPGDLKIDIGGVSYGIGCRIDGLTWYVAPGTTSPYYQIYQAGSGAVDNIHARDNGTTSVVGGLMYGDVVLNPQWDHVDNYTLSPTDPHATAFMVDGTGTKTGAAQLNVVDTGVLLGGTPVYAYEISVDWSLLGITSGPYSFAASWRPDCGNDLIVGNFSGDIPGFPPIVPEPYSIVLAITGLLGVGALRKRA